MLSARSRGTLSRIPAGGSVAKYSGKSQVKCPGWSDTSLDTGQNLHTTVSWRAVGCGSVLRLVHSLTLPGRREQSIFGLESTQIFLTGSCFVLDNSYNWTHRQQLEFAEHRDMILSGIYLFNKTWQQVGNVIISNYCLIPGHAGATCEQPFPRILQQTKQFLAVRGPKEKHRGSHSKEKTEARGSPTEVPAASILGQNI